MAKTFKALLLEEQDKKINASFRELREDQLPEGDVTVAVEYSSLNYKDGMAIKGLGKLVRKYPHVPGIDLAGTVAASSNPAHKPGDKVVLTGWRVGEWHWGGYAQLARVKAEWLLPLPAELSPQQAMAIGTAGIAAMQAVMALEEHGLKPDQGEVLVTGATGGVGSLAVLLLANLGYKVAASTGRKELHDYLNQLGAQVIIHRAELSAPSERPLEPERWVGCVDSVGGTTLARVLAQTKYRCSVTSVGLAGGNKLETTVLPFLLRGVNLLGIDSAMCPIERRKQVWARLAKDLPRAKLDAITTVAPLGDLIKLADEILQGHIRGRTVIDMNA
ncbi:MAG: oxidoreductase [Pseudomonadota bacterium]|nr:MAG: oxidoreductase [Pseudomonadota bacterium]